MSQNNIQNSHPRESDEIDLLQLFRGLGNWVVKFFKGLFNYLLTILIFLLRKWVYLVLALVIGVGTSYFLKKVQKDLYYSDIVIKSNAVSNQEMISYINRLGSLTKVESKENLSNELGISLDEVEKINEIKAYWFLDKSKDGIIDIADFNDRFLADTNYLKVEEKLGVRVTVIEPNVFSILSEGLKNYINSNTYFRDVNKQRLENLKEIISQTNNEVEKLDSLQKKEYFLVDENSRLKEGQLVFTNDKEIKLFHKDLIELVELKQEKELEYNIHNEIVTVLEDFTISQSPVNGMIFYLKKILPFSILLLYCLALIIQFRNQIRNTIKG